MTVAEQVIAKAIQARLCACCNALCPDGPTGRYRGERICSWACMAHMVTGKEHR